jgi:hypothetical protein
MPDLYELMPLLTRLALQAGDQACAAAACAAAHEAAEREPLPIKSATARHCRSFADGRPGPAAGRGQSLPDRRVCTQPWPGA